MAIRIIVEFLFRPHFMTPEKLTRTISQSCAHQICGGNAIVDVPPTTGHIGDLVVSSPMRTPVLYQPASRFWEFQSIEAGIFVALTLAVLGLSVWLIHRRGT